MHFRSPRYLVRTLVSSVGFLPQTTRNDGTSVRRVLRPHDDVTSIGVYLKWNYPVKRDTDSPSSSSDLLILIP